MLLKWEEWILRKWWVFPCVGVAVAALLQGPLFWGWIGLKAVEGEGSSHNFIKPIAIIIGITLIPVVWRFACLLGQRLTSCCPRLPWALMLTFLVLYSVEWGVRSRVFQVPFWLAVRARAGGNDFFQREVATLRLEHAEAHSSPNPGSELIVIGSSQVLNGIDLQRLQSALSTQDVIRRALYGMTPIKALCAWSYLDLIPQSEVAMWLSAFDFTNQAEFPIDWFRPLASWEGTEKVLKCYSNRRLYILSGKIVDLGMASTFELWSIRDYVHAVWMRFLGVPLMEQQQTGPTDEQRRRLAESLKYHVEVMPFEQKAFVLLAERLRNLPVQLTVFEGQVSPELRTTTREQYDGMIRNWLQDLAAINDYSFIPLRLQTVELTGDDWLDLTHLNAQGRAKYTDYVARYYQQAVLPVNTSGRGSP